MLYVVSSRRGPLSTATAVLAVGVMCVGLTVTACGDDGPSGDAAAFCTDVEAEHDALTRPDLASSDDIEPFLDLYRRIGQSAPLAIETEWNQLIVNYETASTVVPGDDDSEQIAIATALRTEKSAVAVNDWLETNCGVDLGPVTTVAPQR